MSSGDSFWDSESKYVNRHGEEWTGASVSCSTGQVVEDRGRDSYHNAHRGNRGVDVRGNQEFIGMPEDEFVENVHANTAFSVYKRPDTPTYRLPDGHYHLTCNSRECIDAGIRTACGGQ